MSDNNNLLAQSGFSDRMGEANNNPEMTINDMVDGQSDASSVLDIQKVERFSTTSMSDAGSTTMVVQKLGLSKKASLVDESMNNISMATIEENGDADGGDVSGRNSEVEVGNVLAESTQVVTMVKEEENESDWREAS